MYTRHFADYLFVELPPPTDFSNIVKLEGYKYLGFSDELSESECIRIVDRRAGMFVWYESYHDKGMPTMLLSSAQESLQTLLRRLEFPMGARIYKEL